MLIDSEDKIFEGFYIYHYKEVSSTNLVALDLIDRGISYETAIIADKQTSGKGRNGKIWLSPEGNLYVSFIINQKMESATEYAFIAALTIGNTLLSIVNELNVQYKWPNDVLIDAKKVSGILLEKKSNSNWLVIGIGINIACAPISRATCMMDYGNYTSKIDLLKIIISNFNKLRRQKLYCGFHTIREIWLKRAFKLNETINIKLADKLYQGVFTDIDEYGRLILRKKNRDLIYFYAGELFNMS